MPTSFIMGRLVDSYRKTAVHMAFSFKNWFTRILVIFVTIIILVWLALLLYGSFYYVYVPKAVFYRPIHFQFRGCADRAGMCSFPECNVSLTNRWSEPVLTRGQEYSLILQLNMPESPVNQQLGMFMVRATVRDRQRSVTTSYAVSTMLRYRSSLLHILSTFYFAPFLLTGYQTESQFLEVDLFPYGFEEHVSRPSVEMHLEIESRFIEIYSAQLAVHARFSGLRYLMFQYPLLCGVVGVCSNMCFLCLLVFLSWYRFFFHPLREEDVIKVTYGEALTLEERRARVQSRIKKLSMSSQDVPIVDPGLEKSMKTKGELEKNEEHSGVEVIEQEKAPSAPDTSSFEEILQRSDSIPTMEIRQRHLQEN